MNTYNLAGAYLAHDKNGKAHLVDLSGHPKDDLSKVEIISEDWKENGIIELYGKDQTADKFFWHPFGLYHDNEYLFFDGSYKVGKFDFETMTIGNVPLANIRAISLLPEMAEVDQITNTLKFV